MALHLKFLAMNPIIVLASLIANLKCFACFKSRDLFLPARPSVDTIDVVCMVTVSCPKVHDFTVVKVERHLPIFRPLDNPVKVCLDDPAICRHEGHSAHFGFVNKLREERLESCIQVFNVYNKKNGSLH